MELQQSAAICTLRSLVCWQQQRGAWLAAQLLQGRATVLRPAAAGWVFELKLFWLPGT